METQAQFPQPLRTGPLFPTTPPSAWAHPACEDGPGWQSGALGGWQCAGQAWTSLGLGAVAVARGADPLGGTEDSRWAAGFFCHGGIGTWGCSWLQAGGGCVPLRRHTGRGWGVRAWREVLQGWACRMEATVLSCGCWQELGWVFWGHG